MKRLPVLALVTLLLASCSSPADKAKQEAIAALKIPAGSTFTTYVDKIAEANQKVNAYSSVPNANATTLSQMKAALKLHVMTGQFWQCSLETGGDGVMRQCQTQQLKAIAQDYPAIRPYVDELKTQVPAGYAFNDVNKEKALGILWAEADKEVKEIK